MSNFPSFYNPDNVGNRYAPNIAKAIEEGAAASLRPASKDDEKNALVIVDAQIDFVLEDGNLPVTGAVGDVQRTIEFIYNKPEQISTIISSLDQHIPFQIFYGTWWADKDGKHPAPYTPITEDDVNSGKWRPLLDKQWSINYVKQLKTIMIWPPHCMIGTEGAALVPALSEAIAWLSAARKIQPTYIFKGTVPQSEHYGIFCPCVPVTNHAQGTMNTVILDTIAKHNSIFVCGEAEDFCVRDSMKQLLGYFEKQPDVIQRVKFMEDCTSLVFPDKRDEADKVLEEMESKGVQLISSTD